MSLFRRVEGSQNVMVDDSGVFLLVDARDHLLEVQQHPDCI